MIFWDLQKAFARVPWTGLWATLARQGCIEHSKMRARSLHEGMVHDGMVGTVSHQSSVTDEFPITGGIKQGCVLEPTLFGIYLSTMLKEVSPRNGKRDAQYSPGREPIQSSPFQT